MGLFSRITITSICVVAPSVLRVRSLAGQGDHSLSGLRYNDPNGDNVGEPHARENITFTPIHYGVTPVGDQYVLIFYGRNH